MCGVRDSLPLSRIPSPSSYVVLGLHVRFEVSPSDHRVSLRTSFEQHREGTHGHTPAGRVVRTGASVISRSATQVAVRSPKPVSAKAMRLSETQSPASAQVSKACLFASRSSSQNSNLLTLGCLRRTCARKAAGIARVPRAVLTVFFHTASDRKRGLHEQRALWAEEHQGATAAELLQRKSDRVVRGGRKRMWSSTEIGGLFCPARRQLWRTPNSRRTLCPA